MSFRDRILAGEFVAVLLSPPCATYSKARKHDGGPPPLRGACGRDLYGFKHLKAKDKEAVRLGTLLAIRSAQFIQDCEQVGIPWLLENPPMEEGAPSLFNIEEVQEVTNLICDSCEGYLEENL